VFSNHFLKTNLAPFASRRRVGDEVHESLILKTNLVPSPEERARVRSTTFKGEVHEFLMRSTKA
jgi:hypothetical protein